MDIGDFENNTAYTHYSTFSIGDSITEFGLNKGGYSSTAGDGLISDAIYGAAHNYSGMKFSTKDNINDNYGGSCAIDWEGAWWLNSCMQSHVSGSYHPNGGHVKKWSGVLWYDWKSSSYSLKFTEMKVRQN